MAWLSDKWRKLNEVALVEQDNALCLKYNPLLIIVITALLVFPVVFVSAIIYIFDREAPQDRQLIFLLMLLMLAVMMLLMNAMGRKIGMYIVLVNADTLRFRGNKEWPYKFQLPLPMLRRVFIKNDDKNIYIIQCELTDGTTKTVSMLLYQPGINTAITDFLQRKLPPSIQLTVDNEPPLFGRGGL